MYFGFGGSPVLFANVLVHIIYVICFLIFSQLLFCCFLTTLHMVPSLRAYLVLTNRRMIILYPAMFGKHKAISYPLSLLRSSAGTVIHVCMLM